MDLVHYRDLVGVAYTEEEAKAMALDIEVTGEELKLSALVSASVSVAEMAQPRGRDV